MFQQEKKKKEPDKSGDTVKRIQEYAFKEAERKKKEDEEKKKKKTTVDTAPSKGALGRLYDYFTGTAEKK